MSGFLEQLVTIIAFFKVVEIGIGVFVVGSLLIVGLVAKLLERGE